jgi:hypothetical protein
MSECQFLFSVVFMFQKSYTGNILGIGQNEAWSSYFPIMKTESKGEMEKGQETATPGGGASPPLAMPLGGVGPCSPSDIVLPPIYFLWGENPKESSLRPPKVPQRRRHRRPILGDRNLCSGTLSGWGIAPGAISIDSTAISIDVTVSHDKEGVVLPRGWGLYQ